jgi:hypothetical protein
VKGGLPDSQLDEQVVERRHEQHEQRRQQDGRRQAPCAVDVLDQAFLLAFLPGQLNRDRHAGHQQPEQDELPGPDLNGSRGRRDRTGFGGDQEDDEHGDPARFLPQ